MNIELNGKMTAIEKPVTVLRMFEELALNREAYLVVVNGSLVTEDYRLNKDDEVKLIKVVSGG